MGSRFRAAPKLRHMAFNPKHESLQFTMSSPSGSGTEFLDTFIYNKGYKFNTKVYSKPCDTHSFLVIRTSVQNMC